MDPMLLPRAGNSHSELPLVANPLCQFAFDLGLISKSAHVVLHGCLFLKVFSLSFWVLLFFHWKIEASLGTESPLKYLQIWCWWLKHFLLFWEAHTVFVLWHGFGGNVTTNQSPHLLDTAETPMRATPCPMKSANQTAGMTKSCWHSKTAQGGTAQQLEKKQDNQLTGPEWRSPSQSIHLCPGSCSTFLTTQQQDNLWSWHTHCLVKFLFNHHSKEKSEPRETVTVRWRVEGADTFTCSSYFSSLFMADITMEGLSTHSC